MFKDMFEWLKNSRETRMVCKARRMARDEYRKTAQGQITQDFTGLSKKFGLYPK